MVYTNSVVKERKGKIRKKREEERKREK